MRRNRSDNQHAVDLGIDLIDTAPVYGFGLLRRLLGRVVDGGRHDGVVLA